MDGCFAFWRIGCVVDWEAWGAIGSMLAVFVAVGTTLYFEYRRSKDQKTLLGLVGTQAHYEIRRIYNVCTNWAELAKAIELGEIPEEFDDALDLAIAEYRDIDTPIYDGFSSLIPQLNPRASAYFLTGYSHIKNTQKQLDRYFSKIAEESSQKQFDELRNSAAALRASLGAVLMESSAALGLDPQEQTRPLPCWYLSPEHWRDG